jgi:cytochrome b561
MSDSAVSRYSPPAVALHWLLAVLITGTFALGLYMHELPVSPQRLKLYSWHKWAGIVILALSLLRLLVRLRAPRPRELGMPGWQHAAAQATHHGLYLLFFAVPLVGWAYSSAAGFPVVLFGVLPLPDFVPVDMALAALLKGWHKVLALTLGALVLLHLAAVLKHQLIDRDGLLARMGFSRA